jgi:hypothetical protein
MAKRSREIAGRSLLAIWEARIERQKQLVAELKANGRRTNSAEAALKKFEETLVLLRNHAELMQELVQPEPNKKA